MKDKGLSSTERRVENEREAVFRQRDGIILKKQKQKFQSHGKGLLQESQLESLCPNNDEAYL